MKIIHLSDLHIGKRLNDFSMIEDQKYILDRILEIIDSESPDGIVIAGDVYDKSVPSAEAVSLFDEFLVGLSKRSLPVYIISGNHDSADRLAFANRLIELSGVYISSAYNGNIVQYSLKDEYGAVNIYMLPFIKPVNVRQALEVEEIESYTDAVSVAIEKMNLNKNDRNILVAHQFVMGAKPSDSEDISVGGLDNVAAYVFKDFDYVALGHIHGPQNIGSEKIRYCGTPLKYSLSEANHEKSVTVVEIGKKGDLVINTVPLKPLRDTVEIRGKFDEISQKSYYENTNLQNDYVYIVLTDEEDIPDAKSKLNKIYKNIMNLSYDNTRTRRSLQELSVTEIDNKTPLDLFDELYEHQNGTKLSDDQKRFVMPFIKHIWEDKI